MNDRQVDLMMIGGAALVVGAGLYLVARTVLPKLNPLSADNVAYSGVNAVGASLVTAPDGPGKNADGSWTLGGWLYDVLNADTAQAVKNMSGTTVQMKSVADPETWVPADPNTSSTWGA